MSTAGNLSPSAIEAHAQSLFRALADRTPIDPLTLHHPEMTIDDAYAVQLAFVRHRLDVERSSIVGRKIGATSKPVQEMLAVRQPDFGHLLSSMVASDSDTLAIDDFISPRAEGEIAFLLGRDLAGPGLAAADVLHATDHVTACFEIVDSRIRDWKIKIQDTVADNASSGAFVLGASRVDPRELDLALTGMTIERNGEIVGTGAGAAALGHPLNSVAWLANVLGQFGIVLKAGETILSGALSALVPVSPGDHLRVQIGGIGSVDVHFSGKVSA
jgi:2-oxopent-4-enoate/cis-2-oxohex-4-enoate hydratase